MSGSGAYCCVVQCSNSYKKLRTWKNGICEIHSDMRRMDCPCLQPYKLHDFPDPNRVKTLEKKEKHQYLRQRWMAAINRKGYTPSKNAVVSLRSIEKGWHFILHWDFRF